MPDKKGQISQHECQRVFEVAFERLEPARADGAVDDAVVGRERDLHDLRGPEAALVLGRGHERGRGGADGENARLRRVDDGGEVRDVEHAEVGDGEGAALELVRLQLAVARLLGERLCLCGDGREALGAGVLDDGRDEPVRGGHGHRDVRLLVSAADEESVREGCWERTV